MWVEARRRAEGLQCDPHVPNVVRYQTALHSDWQTVEAPVVRSTHKHLRTRKIPAVSRA